VENPNSLEKQTAEILKPEIDSEGFEFAEKGTESSFAKATEDMSEKISKDNLALSTDQATIGAPGIDSKDSPLHQSVEAILESDLEELYFQMNKQEQKVFKEKGEQTAKQIIELVTSAKATFDKVFKLIKNWLKIIPGVNKFFIEQDAKIKADKILQIK